MKKFLALILSIAMVLSLAACGETKEPASVDSTTPEGAQTTYKDTIVVGTTAAVAELDSQEMSKTVDYMSHRLTHDTLFRYDEETKELSPWLCESWEIDGATWTLHLRDDVSFSNGAPFTAEDVKYTFERGCESSQIASYCKKIDNMEIIDEHTIKITWVSVNVDMGGLFTNAKYSMLSKAACEEDPAKGYEIGTGAYTLEELFDNSYAIYKKNDNYWGEKPITETIEFRYISEASARLIALQNGEIDMCISPATTELDYIRDDATLDLIEVPGASTAYLALNMNKAPFDNLEFRKAVAYAIDKQELIDIVVDGLGSIAKSTIGPNCAAFCDDDLSGYEYNPEEAKAIIAANGWEGTTIKIYCQDSGEPPKTAEVVQAQLKDVGIQVDIVKLASAELKAAAKAGEHEGYIAKISVSDYADAVRTMLYAGAGYNYAFYENSDLDALVDEGVTLTDNAARKAVYVKLQQGVFDENFYFIPFFRANSTVATVKGLGGVDYRSDLILDMAHAYIAE